MSDSFFGILSQAELRAGYQKSKASETEKKFFLLKRRMLKQPSLISLVIHCQLSRNDTTRGSLLFNK